MSVRSLAQSLNSKFLGPVVAANSLRASARSSSSLTPPSLQPRRSRLWLAENSPTELWSARISPRYATPSLIYLRMPLSNMYNRRTLRLAHGKSPLPLAHLRQGGGRQCWMEWTARALSQDMSKSFWLEGILNQGEDGQACHQPAYQIPGVCGRTNLARMPCCSRLSVTRER